MVWRSGGLVLALAFVGALAGRGLAEDLFIKIISPTASQEIRKGTSFTLKVQTEPGSTCVASITTQAARPHTNTLPKATANAEGYVDWKINVSDTATGQREVTITCSHDGKQGKASLSYTAQ